MQKWKRLRSISQKRDLSRYKVREQQQDPNLKTVYDHKGSKG